MQNARYFLIADKDDVVMRDLHGRCLPMRWGEMTYDELRTVLVDDALPQQWPSTGDTQAVDGDGGDGSTGEAEQLAVVAESISIDFLNKSLYNSRYPQYLLAEGIFLGNYSTGKFKLNADVTSSDLKVLEAKFVAAATKMQRDGYFEPMQSAARTKFFLTLVARFIISYAKLYYEQIMKDKHIDIQVSHNHPVNKFGHFWSSVGMILFAYPLIFWYGEPLKGCAWFFLTHVVSSFCIFSSSS